MAKYTISPFGGRNYSRNQSKGPGGSTPCAICGKPIQGPASAWPHVAVVVDGGAKWGDEDSDWGDSGFMGSWPAGSDCHRKYAVKGPACGHSACSQHYIDTGETSCVKES